MNQDVYVSKSQLLNGIRCIKAGRDFEIGEVVESCPVIVITKDEDKYLEQTILKNYTFYWGEDTAIVLGNGSLYNHSYTPNLKFVRDFATMTMNYIALVEIKKDEELFIHYSQLDGSEIDSAYFGFDK